MKCGVTKKGGGKEEGGNSGQQGTRELWCHQVGGWESRGGN